MELGVTLGGSVVSTCGFSDEEDNEDTPQEMTETVSPEEEFVEVRRRRRLELESEGRLAFIQMSQYNQQELTKQRGDGINI